MIIGAVFKWIGQAPKRSGNKNDYALRDKQRANEPISSYYYIYNDAL